MALADGSATAKVLGLAGSTCQDGYQIVVKGTVPLIEKVPGLTATQTLTGCQSLDYLFASFDAVQNIQLTGAVGYTATASGWATGDGTFQLAGDGKLQLPGGLDQSGKVRLNQIGISGCTPVAWFTVGFTYRWGDKTPDTFRGCDLGQFEIARPPAAAASRRAATTATTTVVRGQRLVAFTASAAAGPPRLRLRGPGGRVVESPADGTVLRVDGAVAFLPDPDAKRTTVVVRSPAPGTWSLEAADTGVVLVRPASAGPSASVGVTGAAKVLPDGRVRLSWRMTPQPGRVVTFVERGPRSARTIKTTRAASASVVFRPTTGLDRPRTIEAIVTDNGITSAAATVARFTVRPVARPVRPGGCRRRCAAAR